MKRDMSLEHNGAYISSPICTNQHIFSKLTFFHRVLSEHFSLSHNFTNLVLMIRRPPRSTLSSSSAASDVYKRQVEPCFTDTRLIRTPCYYGQFALSLGKARTFSLHSTCLIQTPINVDDRQLFSCPINSFSY